MASMLMPPEPAIRAGVRELAAVVRGSEAKGHAVLPAPSQLSNLFNTCTLFRCLNSPRTSPT
jgi:hypothetical protein